MNKGELVDAIAGLEKANVTKKEVDAVLTKPVTLDTIIETVTRWRQGQLSGLWQFRETRTGATGRPESKDRREHDHRGHVRPCVQCWQSVQRNCSRSQSKNRR